MSSSNGFVSCVSKTSYNIKLTALESTLQQSIINFKDIVEDIENLCIESEDFKRKFNAQKEKCESETCSSSEGLKKIIEAKDNIIQLVASSLIRMRETKNMNIIDEAFKILCGETTKVELIKNIKVEKSDSFPIDKHIKTSPKDDSLSDISFQEESVCEIDNTPGRTSPIIQSKKKRNGQNASDYRDKKKCPNDWSTPQSKAIKLIFPSPSSKGKGRLRQSRINLVKLKTVVDLTCSPELTATNSSGENFVPVQPLIKKESTDNEDTILPSPTSGTPNFPSLLKTSTKNSPFKRPPLCLKPKVEKCTPCFDNIENTSVTTPNIKQEESINLLKPSRFNTPSKENSPMKMSQVYEDENQTHCEITPSLSILQHVDKLEQNQCNKYLSPFKQPLAENKNIDNIASEMDVDSSMSLLHREQRHSPPAEDKAKRKILDDNNAIYKEPAARKKIDKRALPGWSCEECKNFYDELYKDDPEMLAKKMEECSKHRGKKNPVRPKTPDGFWNPRWEVPEDTEEFNRRNNAV